MKRRCFLVSLFLYIMVFLLPKFCYHNTGDFWLQTILSQRRPDVRWATSAPPEEEIKSINAVLSQPYRFLGEGMQSFAFLSEDHTTVIKFFKHRFSFFVRGRLRPQRPAPESIFDSYFIAYKQLKMETGVFYLHLNKTKKLHPTLTIVDKLGIRHQINLDDTEFVLQKRADLICPKLRELMEGQNIEEAKRCLTSLIGAMKTMYDQGVKYNDAAIRRNVGIIDQRALFFDAGSLLFTKGRMTVSESKQEALQKGLHLEKWLIKHYPVLYDHYMQCIQDAFGG